MEQNDAEVKQKFNHGSRNQEQQKSITQLKSKISLSNFQMLQLTQNDQKFTDRIYELNEKGIKSIQSGLYEQATLYLGQAQKLLQYAASCGRALDRQIIIKILNNEAVIYQKTWDLQRSISYVEAIIFNIKSYLVSKENMDLVQQLRIKNQEIKKSEIQKQDLEWFMQSQYEKIKSIISKKYQLSLFYLQFSTLNSQNQDHQIALNNANQALKSYRQCFEISLMYLKLKKGLKIQIQEECIRILQQIIKIKQIHEKDESTYKQFRITQRVQQIKRRYDKKNNISSSFKNILEKYSSLQRKQIKYKNFSLTQIMELSLQSFRQKILDQSKLTQDNFYIQDIQNFNNLIYKVLQYSVTFFTISVQIKQIYNQLSLSNNNTNQQKIQPNFTYNLKQAQLYYLTSLQISINIVQQLTQFSRYIFKHYFEIYNEQKPKANTQFISKMDSLKQKYKKYIPNLQNSKKLNQSDDFCDNTISQYSINIKVSVANPKDSKQNKLQKLFKQDNISTPQNCNPAPPRLNIDLSQIQSLQYGGSKTFKQTEQSNTNLEPHQVIIQQEYDNKQTKKLTCLNVKKIKTVPNLSDVSSNKQSSVSKQKSQVQKKSNMSKANKSKSKTKNVLKQNQSKKSFKPINITSKPKMQIKKVVSPRNYNRKSHQANNNNHNNQTQIKKKGLINDKKVFSDRKIFINNDKQNDKQNKELKKQKNLMIFKQKKKKRQEITPQPSHRNNQQKQQTDKNNQRLRQTKKISKLRKAKSHQQIIYPYEDIKPIIYQSKDISDAYNIYQRPKLKQKLKIISQSKKTKSTQNIKLTAKIIKKDKKKTTKLQGTTQIVSQCNQPKTNVQNKDLNTKRKRKPNQNQNVKQHHQSNSSIAWQQNAVRMSSISNLMNSANQKAAFRKLNSSRSLHQSNYSSGYLLKGFNINASQRTKAGSIVMTTSLRKK